MVPILVDFAPVLAIQRRARSLGQRRRHDERLTWISPPRCRPRRQDRPLTSIRRPAFRAPRRELRLITIRRTLCRPRRHDKPLTTIRQPPCRALDTLQQLVDGSVVRVSGHFARSIDNVLAFTRGHQIESRRSAAPDAAPDKSAALRCHGEDQARILSGIFMGDVDPRTHRTSLESVQDRRSAACLGGDQSTFAGQRHARSYT